MPSINDTFLDKFAAYFLKVNIEKENGKRFKQDKDCNESAQGTEWNQNRHDSRAKCKNWNLLSNDDVFKKASNTLFRYTIINYSKLKYCPT